jgi:hypothetical protein
MNGYVFQLLFALLSNFQTGLNTRLGIWLGQAEVNEMQFQKPRCRSMFSKSSNDQEFALPLPNDTYRMCAPRVERLTQLWGDPVPQASVAIPKVAIGFPVPCGLCGQQRSREVRFRIWIKLALTVKQAIRWRWCFNDAG